MGTQREGSLRARCTGRLLDVDVDEIEQDPSDGWAVLPFETKQAFEAWLEDHHADRPGLWVKLVKKGRGIASITFPEALEVAMCFGWVDSKMHTYDDTYFVLRYQQEAEVQLVFEQQRPGRATHHAGPHAALRSGSGGSGQV
jgi:hypothetical protein